jgi:hypothetical protein
MSKLLGFLLFLGLLLFAFFMVDIKKTDDGALPAVSVGEGRLPKFDVDMGSIEVKQEETTVTVPEVQVGQKEKHIALPKLQVKGPNDP